MSPARYAPAIGSGISAPSSPVEHPRLVLERKLASLLGGNGHAGAATATELAWLLREVEIAIIDAVLEAQRAREDALQRTTTQTPTNDLPDWHRAGY